MLLEDTVLCNFSNETMLEILQNVPEFTYALMLFYADELNKSENNIRKIAHMNVRERVIDLLLYIHRKFGQINDLIDIELSRKEIADFAGTTEEQAIRVLSSLKKEMLIKTVGKKLGFWLCLNYDLKLWSINILLFKFNMKLQVVMISHHNVKTHNSILFCASLFLYLQIVVPI